jgi:hypothetical protein
MPGRGGSSLSYMVEDLNLSNHDESGFYLLSWLNLIKINRIRPVRSKCGYSWWGPFCCGPHRKHQFNCETPLYYGNGGMKAGENDSGLHQQLCKALAVSIHSEYGMTGYCHKYYSLEGRIWMPNWIQILIHWYRRCATYIQRESRRNQCLIDPS